MIRAPDVVMEKQLLKNIADKYNLRARGCLICRRLIFIRLSAHIEQSKDKQLL